MLKQDCIISAPSEHMLLFAHKLIAGCLPGCGVEHTHPKTLAKLLKRPVVHPKSVHPKRLAKNGRQKYILMKVYQLIGLCSSHSTN